MPHPPIAPESDTAEVIELVDFLSEQPPFDALPEALRRYAARHMEITYAQKGTVVLEMRASNDRLYLVRTGAVELHDEEGTLVERLGEGEYFGYRSSPSRQPSVVRRRLRTHCFISFPLRSLAACGAGVNRSIAFSTALTPNASRPPCASVARTMRRSRRHSDRCCAALRCPPRRAAPSERQPSA